MREDSSGDGMIEWKAIRARERLRRRSVHVTNMRVCGVSGPWRASCSINFKSSCGLPFQCKVHLFQADSLELNDTRTERCFRPQPVVFAPTARKPQQRAVAAASELQLTIAIRRSRRLLLLRVSKGWLESTQSELPIASGSHLTLSRCDASTGNNVPSPTECLPVARRLDSVRRHQHHSGRFQDQRERSPTTPIPFPSAINNRRRPSGCAASPFGFYRCYGVSPRRGEEAV